jgi:hypothetical protein
MRCAGPLTTHARFEAAAEKTFSLSALAAIALDLLGSDRAGVIVVGEAAGLVGASLRRSPALAGEAADFSFPDIRRWLSFTPDRAFPSSQALIVGVVSRARAASNSDEDDATGADAFLRPISASGLSGHFHAAAFSHRPLPRGPLELKSTVAGLFEADATRGLLHLIRDDRPATGLGESELWRGALWAAAIDRVTAAPPTPTGDGPA